MKDIRAIQTELILGDSRRDPDRIGTALSVQVFGEPHAQLRRRHVLDRQEIFKHADRVAHAEPARGGECRGDRLVLWHPVGPRINTALVDDQVSVVRQSKSRQTEPAAGCGFERPACKQFVQLIVDVRMTDDFAACVGQEQSLNDPEFFVWVLLISVRQRAVRMPA